ncbi:MAG: polysaccharide pyruvyl transferase family protein [Anaerovoracaceae bacterium]
MKKVGLAVVTYKDNFGSALQTYATQYVVEKLGYVPECICADGIMKIIESRKKKFFLKRIFCPDEFKYIFSYATSRFKKKGTNEFSNNMKIRHNKYTEFNNKLLNMSPNVCSIQELRKLSGEYQSVIVGSDQLWRPSNIAAGYFTLEEVPNDVNKIAYSTSFGVIELPNSIKAKAKSFLNRINHLSVREDTGSKIASELTGRSIPVVCDPTMLLTPNEWFDISGDQPFSQGDYIVCYLMGDVVEHRNFVKKLRKETGSRVIGLLHGSTYIAMDEEFPDEKPYDVGPCEFINLIRNAQYVCTDSFHCCVFSIICKTPFFVFRRDSENKTTSSNDRIYTLLNWTGLSDRLLIGNENISDSISKKIDFDTVHKLVDEKRKQSIKYLSDALGDGK